MRRLSLRSRARSFLRCSSGATAIEYGLIGVLVSIMIIGATQIIGQQVLTFFEGVRDALATAFGN